MNREDGTISIEKVGTSYRAYFEYDKDFISWVKKDGHGSWNSAGRYWSLTAKGVLNLLDQHNDKWFNVADDTMEAAKAEIEAEQAEAEHRRQKIEDAQRREADYWATPAEQRLAGIKPIERYDFKSTPYPHQIEAFNYKLIDMDNPLSSIFHLREVTGGLYTEDSENAKLARIKEIIEEEIIPAGTKAIVFSKYEKVAEIYKRQLAEYHPAYMTGSVNPEDRQKEVERFQNDSDCKICIGTIGAMGTGITLTAASTVIFADKDWTVSANRQAEDRAHRIGTTENVNVITVVAKDTIDEYVEGILKDKELYTDLIMEGTDVVMDKTKRPQLIADLLGISEAELKKRVAIAKKENKSKQEKVA